MKIRVQFYIYSHFISSHYIHIHFHHMKWFSVEFFLRLVSKWIRCKSEWHHINGRREKEIIKKERLERKLLCHFLSDSAKIEHFVRIVYYRIRFHFDVVLLLFFLLLLLLYFVKIINVRNGINKAKTNTQTKTNCTCNICASSLYAQRTAVHLCSVSLYVIVVVVVTVAATAAVLLVVCIFFL